MFARVSHNRRTILLALIGVALLCILSVLPRPALSQGQSGSLSGYAWSDTIGWISLNCSNTNSCSTNNYAVAVASDGTLSGYAWSDSIGWISANSSDLAGCPSGTCSAQLVNGVLSGWLKALSGGSAGSGGWDGWISLSGTGYGPVQSSTGSFAGYAWGSDVVGWVDFSSAVGVCTPVYTCSGQTIQYTNAQCQTSSQPPCVAPAFCSPGSAVCLYPQPTYVPSGSATGHLQVTPSLVVKGGTTQVQWALINVKSCTVTGTNGDTWNATSSPAGGYTSSPITAQTTYTLSCIALDGSAVPPESQTVTLRPVYQEK